MPYLRQRLADPKDGLGIPLEFGVDPLTAVARGAAIFAGGRRLEGASAPVAKGQYAVQLDYQPVGPDTEPLVGGQVRADDGKPLAGFTIEFVNAAAGTPWRSGRLALGTNGTFMTSVWAEKGTANTFLIELRDAVGTQLPAVPDRFAYTVGMGAGDPTLIHSVGVALANNETVFFLSRGTPLPARHRGHPLRTAVAINRGQAGHLLKIPVVEGELPRRADRNHLIGTLEIPAEGLNRDLPAGSDIELTIDIDQSRLVRTKAYVPLLDEEFESVVKLAKEAPDAEQLRRDIGLETKRLERVRSKAHALGDETALKVLERINGERMVHDIEAALAVSEVDRDAAFRCEVPPGRSAVRHRRGGGRRGVAGIGRPRGRGD